VQAGRHTTSDANERVIGPRTKGVHMKIMVIGGTGLIGSKLVNKLRENGRDPVAASPATDVNTLTPRDFGIAQKVRDAAAFLATDDGRPWGF
jgi:nucleoside-diphosphate-sugar epimerase